MIDPTFAHALPPVDADPDRDALTAIALEIGGALAEFVASEAAGSPIAIHIGKISIVRGDDDGVRLDVTIAAGADLIAAVKRELAK